jgi:hypothetical protein
MRSWNPSLGDRAAFAFLVLAAAFIVLALLDYGLGGWASNLAAESLGIAATVLVIERILRVEERRRRAPRVNAVVDYMGWEFSVFLTAVARDYATTHREGDINPVAFELLDQWLAGQDKADADHIGLDIDGKTLVDLAWDLGEQVEPFDRNDRDVLEPDLVAAVRELFRSVRIARERLSILRLDPPPIIAENAVRLAYGRVVRQARAFGEVLQRYAERDVFRLTEEAIREAEAMRSARFTAA